jgi:hypothetical protein
LVVKSTGIKSGLNYYSKCRQKIVFRWYR